ncbi:3'-5' exonuclease [Reichenbachiella versicolor]|uniref:3'-5' exonuclease n=1 Tax=Reichenbachiella versicolor TaxID=1821036 RepID=UPI000D6EA1F2|nr:3'-5' exonuclease [Reichenbachiella versicolor]
MEVRKITKEEVNALPLIKFEGEICLIDKVEDVAAAIEYLSKHELIGFDTETKPAFKKGQVFPVALLQLATKERAFLFRLLETGFTNEMVELFQNPSVAIAGIGIHDDIKDLQKLKDFEPSGFVDLNVMAKELEFESIGARNFAGMFLKGRISKSQQVSNWENEVLTEAQISYAATDAWICIEVYERLLSLEV